ncbi:MAG TPA: MmcQ/YjbR family DNA-binding protein [Candidatus Saccharibacteria bacterium]|jgi:predicted DNA-binding protein (MmcQ/YjbR family)|nr:MmcQ/YjbR family DNA-binding protein [Candidatus Saccharibacteria bacterium]
MMIKFEEIEKYLLSLPSVQKTYPFGENPAVYKYFVSPEDEGKMIALIAKENVEPVNLSLKCDPNLSLNLREKYDEVMPGYHLNKKHWNTIVCGGQLSLAEVQDLILHSYLLVSGKEKL